MSLLTDSTIWQPTDFTVAQCEMVKKKYRLCCEFWKYIYYTGQDIVEFGRWNSYSGLKGHHLSTLSGLPWSPRRGVDGKRKKNLEYFLCFKRHMWVTLTTFDILPLSVKSLRPPYCTVALARLNLQYLCQSCVSIWMHYFFNLWFGHQKGY